MPWPSPVDEDALSHYRGLGVIGKQGIQEYNWFWHCGKTLTKWETLQGCRGLSWKIKDKPQQRLNQTSSRGLCLQVVRPRAATHRPILPLPWPFVQDAADPPSSSGERGGGRAQSSSPGSPRDVGAPRLDVQLSDRGFH